MSIQSSKTKLLHKRLGMVQSTALVLKITVKTV